METQSNGRQAYTAENGRVTQQRAEQGGLRRDTPAAAGMNGAARRTRAPAGEHGAIGRNPALCSCLLEGAIA